MARRVFLHIGLPKTGTSYLQTILWSHRPQLREAGLLVPGRERRDHLWSSLVVRQDQRVRRRGARAADSWARLLREMAAWEGDAVVSHEFFAAASEQQAARVFSALAPAQVHLVVTAREPLGLFTSSWQESLKNKSTTRLEDYGRTVSGNPRVVWNWRALDLGLVLQRWAADLPPENVHVITAPPADAPREELWSRWCQVLDLDPSSMATDVGFSNSSMGVVEAETLRRVNEHLEGFDRALDRGVWIRSFLADERLVPRGGERFWPGPDQVEDCRQRGAAAVSLVRERGFHVVGELDSLLVPSTIPPRRHPSDVTDAEVASVAVELAARLLSDVKNGVRGPSTSQKVKAPEHVEPPSLPHRLIDTARRRVRRR